jgi:hypothetical protein
VTLDIGTCSYCAHLKALTGQGVVSLHYLPSAQPGRRRRRCPGSFRAPREVHR